MKRFLQSAVPVALSLIVLAVATGTTAASQPLRERLIEMPILWDMDANLRTGPAGAATAAKDRPNNNFRIWK